MAHEKVFFWILATIWITVIATNTFMKKLNVVNGCHRS
jgi:hypothetical protein